MEKLKDNGLIVLENIFDELSPKFSKLLLRECYKIEKEHQYEKDRNQVCQLLKKCVEGYFLKNSNK